MAAGPGNSAGPSALPDPGVAVWEWQDELGWWRPYRSSVCSFIEQSFQTLLMKGRRLSGTWPVSGSISLGQADASLAPYIIDIQSLTQFRQDTEYTPSSLAARSLPDLSRKSYATELEGSVLPATRVRILKRRTMRAVRRHVFQMDSAAGQGVVWEWQNDEGGWFPYEMNVCVYLEQAFTFNCPQVDLGPFGYNYTVDFVAQTQNNKTTGYQRKIRRRVDSPYPVAMTTGPAHAGPTCSCQQCLLNSGSGPITTRYRHSMVNLPGSSSGMQGAGRTAGFSSSLPGFLPYNKPTMTGARSMPRLNTHSTGATLQPAAVGGPSPSHAVTPKGVSVPKLPVSMTRPSKVSQALAGMMAFLMSAPGLPVHLTPAPQPASSHRVSKKRNSVKEGRKMHTKGASSSPEEVVKKYLEELKVPPADEDCIICMEKLAAASGYSDVCDCKGVKPESVGRLSKCNHAFHLLCLIAMYTSGNKDGSLQCPSCKAIYGEKTGTQPSGRMEVSKLPDSLPGHEDCSSILIAYHISKGIQGPEHPNPGVPYTARGFPRYCYLPDNPKGRKVLELLRLAWKRRLIFTVGTSSTTGESNTVVWNEIHHKTEMNSNTTGHGYPDPNYLDNVLAELAAQGITEDCLSS